MNFFSAERKEAACSCSICGQYPKQEPIQVKARDPSGQEVMVELKGKTAERFRAFMDELNQESTS